MIVLIRQPAVVSRSELREGAGLGVAGLPGVLVIVISLVVGMPLGSVVSVPPASIARPAVKRSVTLRVMVVEVRRVIAVLSIVIRRPSTRMFCSRYSARSARSLSQGGLPGT
ncbi:hypothetical protein ACWEOO_39665 [Kribbella sp. NPDC004138]